MQKKAALVRSTVPLALAGLLLAGCSAGEQSPEPADSDATLRVNFGQFPENWSPGQEMEGGPLRIPYETLLAPAVDGEPQPFLATEYELTDEAITLTLRDDVTFHDGEPFNAEAVATNVEFVKNSATAYAGPLQAIESVDVVDEFTVRLNLVAPTPSIANTLTTRVLPIGSPAAIEDGSIAQTPVGTSPWAYDEEQSVLGTRMIFSEFEDYWGETPGFANIELVAIEEAESVAAALTSGEIDVSDVEPDVLPRFEGTSIETLQYPAIRNNLFFFDRGPGGVFEDVELRQAVCTAINVQQLAEIESDILAAKQHFAEGEVGYNPDITGYPHDLDEAQDLYAEAGSPSVQLDMVAAPYNAQQIEIFMTQASELGDFNVSVQTLPPPQYNSEWNSGRYALGLSSNDESTPFEWYSAWFAADAPGNPAGVESDELRAAADAAIAAGSSEEADALWAEVTKIIADEALTCAHARGLETLAWNTETVSGVDAPDELWEPKLVNFRELTPAQ
ncbi:ABC transporter substrate-binding protein [Salinibacterium sp. SYSU T00001]|uniref:ABC transporter substrate-binding protein n=1 Tax=Homoserinimonas sedimenticola TaxID=2986805 RepID=UPI0022369691|nr:ABC transporter substrate-binding protein [Salinibacterium sedimenticola]MCW4385672.1 ABC transporter substrate-binding protein [Salinibacterium sedimenticola]